MTAAGRGEIVLIEVGAFGKVCDGAGWRARAASGRRPVRLPALQPEITKRDGGVAWPGGREGQP